MTRTEIHALEHAGRAAFAWAPEPDESRLRYGAVLGAMLPAIGILAAASAFLFVAF